LAKSVQPALSSPPIAQSLQRIWEQVLQRSPISFTDNFYDVGGNRKLADDLFLEIARVHGRQLPAATIGHAPTILAQGALLERPELPRFSPFIPIKQGRTEPPIYIAHGLSGMVEFYQLAKHIRTGHAIYGIQARGLDGREEPFERVEDMAAFYREALTQTNSTGPHLLIGYSFGGLVALEMAQQLVEGGAKVALLVLVDTFPHPRFMPAEQRVRLALQRMRRHGSTMGELPLRHAFSYFVRGLQRRMHLARPAEPGDGLAASRWLLVDTAPYVNRKAYSAYMNYQPRFYPGAVKLVTTDKQTFFPGDPTIVWRPLVAELSIDVIPGDHLNIVGSECQVLASVLSRYLQELRLGSP